MKFNYKELCPTKENGNRKESMFDFAQSTELSRRMFEIWDANPSEGLRLFNGARNILSQDNGKTDNNTLTASNCKLACNENANCTKFCYTCSSYHMSCLSVQVRHTNNMWCCLRYPEIYKARVSAELAQHSAIVKALNYGANGKPYVRLNDDGDLYQEFIDIVIELANEYPEITFFGMTKQYELLKENYKRFPNNMIIKPSADDNLVIPEELKALGVLYVQEKMGNCAYQQSNGKIKCGTCLRCAYNGLDVYFMKH